MDDVFFANLGLTYSDDVTVRADQLAKLNQTIRTKTPSNRPPIPEFARVADDYQAAVIESNAETIRLIAPAGSGKTQTMVNRVLRLVTSGHDPERILLLTFDNSAVEALTSKLEESIDNSDEARSIRTYFDRMQITTLNAFSYRSLGKFARHERKSVADQRDMFKCFDVVRRSFRESQPDYEALLPQHLLPRYYLDLFSFLKNEIQDPRNLNMGDFLDILIDSKFSADVFETTRNETLDANRIMALAKVVAALYVLYDRELQSKNIMDLDDQKLRLYSLLRKDDGQLKTLQSRFDEVIVDEFQDINRLDFELIRQIAGSATLVVTGDDDQAIYGFRGCTPDYIIDLPHHLGRSVDSFELQINYRSPANIVRHADQLIQHNLRRIKKSPKPFHRHDATISLIPTLSSAIEAKSVRNLVKFAVESNEDVQYKDIAILYRTNAQSLPVQIEFLLSGIPYFVRDADNILTNESLAKMLSLLRAKVARKTRKLIGLEDQLNVFRSYFRYFNPEVESRLRKKGIEGVDLLAEANKPIVSAILPKLVSSNFYSSFDELLAADRLSHELDIISRRFGNGLKGMIGSLEEAMSQDVPLAEVFDMARDYEGDTQEFLNMIELALDQGHKSRAGHNRQGVSLLTYFKSKGRQWHTVVLLSCNEGFIPHALSSVEEERRLFYVAMTRASSDLVLSYVENAVHQRLKPSRFLFESGLLDTSASN